MPIKRENFVFEAYLETSPSPSMTFPSCAYAPLLLHCVEVCVGDLGSAELSFSYLLKNLSAGGGGTHL